MFRFAIGGVLAALFAIAISEGTVANAQEVGTIEIDWTHQRVGWVDLPGEASYRIAGGIGYLEPPSCAPTRNPPQESVEFDQALPANTTSFTFPGPGNSLLTWAKSGHFTLEALAADGSRLAINGAAWEADQFCSEEDELAAELAAAGTGFNPPQSPVAGAAMLGLLVFGLATVGAGVALRKVP